MAHIFFGTRYGSNSCDFEDQRYSARLQLLFSLLLKLSASANLFSKFEPRHTSSSSRPRHFLLAYDASRGKSTDSDCVSFVSFLRIFSRAPSSLLFSIISIVLALRCYHRVIPGYAPGVLPQLALNNTNIVICQVKLAAYVINEPQN